jgi:hypothetical protein
MAARPLLRPPNKFVSMDWARYCGQWYGEPLKGYLVDTYTLAGLWKVDALAKSREGCSEWRKIL